MSNLNITFKNKKYSIDKSLLEGAISELETVLEGLSAGGSGGLEPITWDGNIEGRDVCTVEDSSYSLCKVDDRVFTADQFDGATLFMSYNGTEVSQPMTKDMCFGNDNTLIFGEMMVMSSSVTGEVSITSASGNTSLSAVLHIPSAGTYFVDMSSMGLIMTRIEFPS